MLELMGRPELLPFMVALVLTLLFFILELLSLMLGGGVSPQKFLHKMYSIPA